MTESYPFYYEVRFKLLAFDSENNVRIEPYRKRITAENPLEAREEAFSLFNEYVSYAKEHKRLKKDHRGNYFIFQPTGISNYFKDNGSSQKNKLPIKKKDNQKFFREDISIYIIVTDEELAKYQLGALYTEFSVQTEFEIHKIASYDYEEQFIIDNLQDIELKLIHIYDLKISHLVEEVFHYGMDYAESGEVKEDGARRFIMKTPQIWQSYDEYIARHRKNESHVVKDRLVDSPSINYAEVISKGESNQVEFKPCLLYNFKTGKGGIGVKYIIAKAICAFLNSNGGVLFIGVNNNGKIQGIGYDYSLFSEQNKKDKILLEVDSLISEFFGITVKPLIEPKIENIDGKDLLIIDVQKSRRPIFLLNRKTGELEKELFIRLSASTRPLNDPEDIVKYVLNKKWGEES